MEEEKRTPAQWTEFYAQEQQPITKQDYLIGCLVRQNGFLVEIMQAMMHTEGMQASHDDFMARYAEVLGIEYIPSQLVQEALREHRLAQLEAPKETDNVRQLHSG